MFQVDRSQNRLRRLEQQRFSDLKLRERDHLQEWLANQPDALGEDLLIIQKEFDGFADTRERLDLLALDTEGQLVVIENKLDDSGRDVAWQALKYAAYVSSLTKSQIIDIYQQYLDRYCGGGNAAQKICDFLDEDSLDEVVLNPGQDQRLIFIAANFRKEVTSTVLWLREHLIDARCFKVTPYKFEDEILVDIQPVIPTPEAADFMIGMAEKEAEESTAQSTLKRRHKLRLEFWSAALEQLNRDGIEIFSNINPSRYNWLSAGSGVRSCPWQMVFKQNEARVQFLMERSSKAENKRIFDHLNAHRDEVDEKFGAPLEWVRGDETIKSAILYSKGFDGFNRDNWDEMTKWLSLNVKNLEAALRRPLAELQKQTPPTSEELE